MTGPELKACPFCGGDHIAQKFGFDGKAYMSCVNCGANVEGWAGTWNTRAPDPADYRAGMLAGLEAAAHWLLSVPDSLPNRQEYARHIRAIANDPAQVAALMKEVN